MKKVCYLLTAALLLGSFLLAGCSKSETSAAEGASAAQEPEPLDWPRKAITLTGHGAGGDTDIQARIVAKYLGQELGVDVVVVNATGTNAVTELNLRNAPADGYTINDAHNGALIARLTDAIKYQPSEYFTIVGFPVFDPTNCVAAVAEAPYNNLTELKEYMEKNPDVTVTYGTQIAAYTHVQIAAIKQAMGVPIKVVEAGIAAEKNAALLGRKLDMIGSQYGLLQDYFTNGDFKCISLLTSKKPATLQDVPSTVEEGYDVDMDKWFYYFVRKETDPRISQKLNDAMNAITKVQGFQDEISKYYLYSRNFTLDESSKFWDEEYQYYSRYKEALNEVL